MTTEQFNKLIDQLDYTTSELTGNALSNQRCDMTGWSLTEAFAAIALEMRESNKLKLAELQFKQQNIKY